MAKFNLKVFKQGKTLYWVIGAVVLFVIFYLMLNRGGSSATGGTTVVQSGPSEAMQIAGMQQAAAIQTAQMQYNLGAAQIAADREAANLAGQIALAQLTSGENVALQQLEFEKALGEANIAANLQLSEMTQAYSLESARVAAETQLDLRALDVGLLEKQMETQAWMFAKQSDNLIAQSIIAQIGNLKKGDRDNALISLALGAPSSHGSVTGPSVRPGLLPSGNPTA